MNRPMAHPCLYVRREGETFLEVSKEVSSLQIIDIGQAYWHYRKVNVTDMAVRDVN